MGTTAPWTATRSGPTPDHGCKLKRKIITMRLLMIDNYDSFTHNLVQLFYEFHVEVIVRRHDAVTIRQIEALAPHWICVSPGPKDPCRAGISKEVIARLGRDIPTLGVCLGMQAVNEVFGGTTGRAPVPVHGKRSSIRHDGESIFAGIPSPFQAARYHSLCVAGRGSSLKVLAHCREDGVIMGLAHERHPIVGVQFHPESFMTEYGPELIAGFLALHPEWKPLPSSPLLKPAEDRFPRAILPRPESPSHSPPFPSRRQATP